MNRQQLMLREQDAAAKQLKEEKSLGNVYLNCAVGFWEAYGRRPGMHRRRALMEVFRQHPQARLPVNNRRQASTVDPDLQQLLKKGLLVQERGGGSRSHPKNRSSRKRQSYLVLAG